jgi:hypothetical protein
MTAGLQAKNTKLQVHSQPRGYTELVGWSAAPVGRFNLRGGAPPPNTQYVGGWVGPRIGIGTVRNRQVEHTHSTTYRSLVTRM